MSFRRLRGKSEDEDREKADASAHRDKNPTEALAFYSLGTAAYAPGEGDGAPGDSSAQNEASVDADLAAEPREPVNAPGKEGIAYEEVAEHVKAVLSSADEAADRLRASATEEAEQIRAAADDHSAKTRTAADAYADERREEAETTASAIISDAEQQAQSVRDAAEQDAADVLRDAIQRRESLLGESERSEERLRNLLQVFRAMTERLENLVGAERDDERDSDTLGTDAEAEAYSDLAEALIAEPGSSNSRSEQTSRVGR